MPWYDAQPDDLGTFLHQFTLIINWRLCVRSRLQTPNPQPSHKAKWETSVLKPIDVEDPAEKKNW